MDSHSVYSFLPPKLPTVPQKLHSALPLVRYCSRRKVRSTQGSLYTSESQLGQIRREQLLQGAGMSITAK